MTDDAAPSAAAAGDVTCCFPRSSQACCCLMMKSEQPGAYWSDVTARLHHSTALTAAACLPALSHHPIHECFVSSSLRFCLVPRRLPCTYSRVVSFLFPVHVCATAASTAAASHLVRTKPTSLPNCSVATLHPPLPTFPRHPSLPTCHMPPKLHPIHSSQPRRRAATLPHCHTRRHPEPPAHHLLGPSIPIGLLLTRPNSPCSERAWLTASSSAQLYLVHAAPACRLAVCTIYCCCLTFSRTTSQPANSVDPRSLPRRHINDLVETFCCWRVLSSRCRGDVRYEAFYADIEQ